MHILGIFELRTGRLRKVPSLQPLLKTGIGDMSIAPIGIPDGIAVQIQRYILPKKNCAGSTRDIVYKYISGPRLEIAAGFRYRLLSGKKPPVLLLPVLRITARGYKQEQPDREIPHSNYFMTLVIVLFESSVTSLFTPSTSTV